MSQVTIDLGPELAARVRQAAEHEGLSPTEWLVTVIAERLRGDWPDSVKALAGAWEDFPKAQALREGQGADASREPL